MTPSCMLQSDRKLGLLQITMFAFDNFQTFLIIAALFWTPKRLNLWISQECKALMFPHNRTVFSLQNNNKNII